MDNVKIQYQRLLVTPEMAQAFISGGIGNRVVKRSLVKKYARVMGNGLWRPDHKWPLGFTPEMRLVDGQHRCFAVIEHGEPVEFFIDATLSGEDRKIIGAGKPHNAADELAALGNPDGLHVIIAQAVYGWIFRAENGNVWDPGLVPVVEELMDVRERHPGAAEHIKWVVSGTPKCLRQAPVAFIRYVACAASPSLGSKYFDRARDGVGMRDGDPALAMMRALADCTTGRKRASSPVIGACVALGWRAEMEGRQLSRIVFRRKKDGMPPILGIESVAPSAGVLIDGNIRLDAANHGRSKSAGAS